MLVRKFVQKTDNSTSQSDRFLGRCFGPNYFKTSQEDIVLKSGDFFMHNFQTNSPRPFLEITYGGFEKEEDAKEMERLLKESFQQYDVVVKRHETIEDPTGYPI